MNTNFEYTEFLEKEIVTGKELKVEGKIIIPVIQLIKIEFEDKFFFETITPIAIAIMETESGEKYLLPLIDEESEEYQSIKLDEIFI